MTQNEFEIQILDVQYIGEGCEECVNIVVTTVYYDIIHHESINDPDFYNKLMSLGRVPWDPVDYDTYIYAYKKGECRQGGGQLCDYEKRCCRLVINIGFSENPPYIMTGFEAGEPDEIYPDCPPYCQPYCDEYPVAENPCDTKCLYDDWDPEIYFGVLEIPDCPGCIINYSYQKRIQYCTIVNDQNQYEDREYKDYQILEYTKSTDCGSCWYEENDFYSHITKDLLHDGGHALPDVGDCIDDYRIINSNCWKFDINNYWHLIPCEEESCCWSEYRICNENGTLVETKTGGEWFSFCNEEGCIALCSSYPTIFPFPSNVDDDSIETPENLTYAVPNPSTGIVDIHFFSTFDNNLTIELYDFTLNKIKDINFIKNSQKAIIQLDLTEFANGLYFYYIKSGYNGLASGSFILSE